MIQEYGGEQYIVRFARQDQYPPGTNLQDAARDSVIRYARHYGLIVEWVHDQAGTVWQWVPYEGARYGIGVLPGGPDGSFVQKSPITVMWRSVARVIGREPCKPVRQSRRKANSRRVPRPSHPGIREPMPFGDSRVNAAPQRA